MAFTECGAGGYANAAERIQRGEADEGLKPTIDAIVGPGGWDWTPEPERQTFRDTAATLLGQIKEQRAPRPRRSMRRRC
jgi:hypothetical protein